MPLYLIQMHIRRTPLSMSHYTDGTMVDLPNDDAAVEMAGRKMEEYQKTNEGINGARVLKLIHSVYTPSK